MKWSLCFNYLLIAEGGRGVMAYEEKWGRGHNNNNNLSTLINLYW